MGAALIITLRETLEASLVVGIILAYLNKTKNSSHKKYVWGGVLAGIGLSVVLAVVFKVYLGGFEGQAEEIYEGIAMLTATALLTWMIFWMMTQRKNLKRNLEDKVESHVEGDNPWGLFFLTFVSVAREGIETVIFLQAALIQSSGSGVLTGGIAGVLLAIVMSYLLFRGVTKIPLRSFFTFSSVLLILFAAGLFAHGIHELQEAGLVPVLMEHVWDINPEVIVEGQYPLMHESGAIGSLLKGLFGYNGNPNMLEVAAYVVYLVGITLVWRRVDKRA